jgi:uncharacterized repeat protein (TIGR03803 family)
MPRFALSPALVAGLVLAITVMLPNQSQAARLRTLYSFCALPNCTDGDFPDGLIADPDGDLFGTTLSGGTSSVGTVFELAKTRNGYSAAPAFVYSFCAQAGCADGSYPRGLGADADGNVFGTAGGGGANNQGTLFEFAKTSDGYASTPTILYSFCAQADCTDGADPLSGVIVDAEGNLFGTTNSGGAHNKGTVFELAKTSEGYAAAPTILYSFCAQPNCADGGRPNGLTMDAEGDLFGTTNGNIGLFSGEVLFEIVKTSEGYASTPTILYTFCVQPPCTGDGTQPGQVIADPHGDLFGTTGGAGRII